MGHLGQTRVTPREITKIIAIIQALDRSIEVLIGLVLVPLPGNGTLQKNPPESCLLTGGFQNRTSYPDIWIKPGCLSFVKSKNDH